ncbi:MAG: hypothetical protein JO073_02765 [Actinobacteria bacterium]|nr:hypothetical protein [Actinomycetota bacterium]
MNVVPATRLRPPAPAATVANVVARLREIEASAPESDGVVCFARLYREVTEAVAADLRGRAIEAPEFVTRLDVRFAGLFFAAVDAWNRSPGAAPRAWAPLFEARACRGIAPLQFALAGMNAHINRDLPVALSATCAELRIAPDEDSAQHDAYEHVNVLLGQVEQRLKPTYLTGLLGALDRLVHRVHRLDDVVAMWDVARARDAAWANGRALWTLRDDGDLADDFLAALDRGVGLAGRGLLVPADTFLGRLARL